MSVHHGETVSAGLPAQEHSLRGTVASVSRNDVYSFTKPAQDEIMLVTGLGVAGDVHAGVTVRHRSRVAADPDQPNLRQVHLIRSELHDELSEAGYDVPAGGLGENITTAGIDLLALPVGTILRFGPAREDASTPGPAAISSPEGKAGTAATAGTAGPPEGAAAVVTAARRADLDPSVAAAVAALAARIAAESPAGSIVAESPVGSIAAESPAGSIAAEPSAGSIAAERTPSAPDARPAIVVTGLRNPCQQINNYRPGLLKRVLTREPDGTVNRRAGVMAVVLRGGAVRPGSEIDVELPPRPHLPLDRV